MTREKLLQKINSVKLCLTAHPDYQEGSEFEDRVHDLIEIMEQTKDHDNIVDASKALIESVKMTNDVSIENGRGKIISPHMAMAIARLNLALKVKEQ